MRSGRLGHREHRPAGRQEARAGILGIDARLDGMTAQPDVVLTVGQRLPRCDADLPLDQVDTRGHLRHRVFDLKAGVHLHEEELVGPVGGHDELNGARPEVIHAPCGIASRGADPRTGGLIKQRRGRLLDDLLVAALQAALPLAEVQHGAMGVGEHLDLDMPGAQHESFQEERVVPEGRRSLAAGTGQCGRQFRGFLDPAHALTATTGGWFDQHGVADNGCRGDQIGVGESGLGDTGNHRNPERRHR